MGKFRIIFVLFLFCLSLRSDYSSCETLCFIRGEQDLRGSSIPDNFQAYDYGSYIAVIGEKSDIESKLSKSTIRDYPQNPYVISLGKYRFDPLVSYPVLPSELMIKKLESCRYFVVQFKAPTKNEWILELFKNNVKPIYYIPNYTYLVRGEKKAILFLKGMVVKSDPDRLRVRSNLFEEKGPTGQVISKANIEF